MQNSISSDDFYADSLFLATFRDGLFKSIYYLNDVIYHQRMLIVEKVEHDGRLEDFNVVMYRLNRALTRLSAILALISLRYFA